MRDSAVLIRAGARSSGWGKAALGKADGLHGSFSMQPASFALSKWRLNRGLSLAAGDSHACEWAFPSREPFIFGTVAPESCLSVANKETAMRSHGRFRLSSQQMPDGGDGVPRDHAGAAVAHHLADALAHFRLVAVVLAGIAAGFHVHLAASARAQRRVFVELRAFRAHGFAAYRCFGSAGTFMIAGAIQRHHLRDGLLLASSALRDFRGVLLHAGPPTSPSGGCLCMWRCSAGP